MKAHGLSFGIQQNVYQPHDAEILNIIQENSLVNTYALRFMERDIGKGFSFEPGQFMMISVPHSGEAPISISSGSSDGADLYLTVRRSGRLTSALHQTKIGDKVALRGPYGRPFPMDRLKGREVIIVAGGIGLAPLRPVIMHCLKNIDELKGACLLYGCKSPSEMIFSDQIDLWSKANGFQCLCTVDQPHEGWDGRVGLVTILLDEVRMIDPANSIAIICGPPVMIRFVAKRLMEMGLRKEDIITTLERHMKCGVGLCGHCFLEGRLVCVDGPIFNYSELVELGQSGRLLEVM